MLITFDPLYLLLLIFLINLLPGALLSLSILKDKKLFFVEKVLIGSAIGLVLPALFLFIISFFGILFSYQIAIFSVLLFYAVSIYASIKTKFWESYKSSSRLGRLHRLNS